MSCIIDAGLDFTCEDRKNSAGMQSSLYIANLEDIDKVTSVIGVDGDLTTLALQSTTQLYKITVPKNANDAGYETESADGSGNPFFKHVVNLQMSAAVQQQLNAIEGLVYATNLVFFMPTKGKIVNVYGWDDGISLDTGTQNSGKTGSDNNLHQISFSGESNEIYKQYLDTDYDTTIAALEALLTPVP
jgi:hypothetical protein